MIASAQRSIETASTPCSLELPKQPAMDKLTMRTESQLNCARRQRSTLRRSGRARPAQTRQFGRCPQATNDRSSVIMHHKRLNHGRCLGAPLTRRIYMQRPRTQIGAPIARTAGTTFVAGLAVLLMAGAGLAQNNVRPGTDAEATPHPGWTRHLRARKAAFPKRRWDTVNRARRTCRRASCARKAARTEAGSTSTGSWTRNCRSARDADRRGASVLVAMMQIRDVRACAGARSQRCAAKRLARSPQHVDL